jgi:uncharacterized membrane protein YgcG
MAQQLAPQAAALPADPANRARLHLPPFKGENNAHTTRTFARRVDGFMQVSRLTQEETAQAVAFSFVPGSPADVWLENLLEAHPAQVETWALLRPLLLARFSPTLTPSEEAAIAAHCTQHRGEDVQTFIDRCENTQILLERRIPNAQRVQAFAVPFAANHEVGVMALFLRGLRDEQGLKGHVNGTNAVNLAEYLAEAIRFERHVTKQIKITVAEVAETGTDYDGGEEYDEEDGEEIANLRPGQGKKKKPFGQGGRGRTPGRGGSGRGGFRGRGGGGRGQFGGGRGGGGGGGGDRPPPRCWNCNSTQHLNAACPEPKKGGGGRGGRGGFRGGAPGSDGHQMQAMIMQLGNQQLQHLIKAGGNARKGGNVDSVDYEPPEYDQHQRNPRTGFWE